MQVLLPSCQTGVRSIVDSGVLSRCVGPGHECHVDFGRCVTVSGRVPVLGRRWLLLLCYTAAVRGLVVLSGRC